MAAPAAAIAAEIAASRPSISKRRKSQFSHRPAPNDECRESTRGRGRQATHQNRLRRRLSPADGDWPEAARRQSAASRIEK